MGSNEPTIEGPAIRFFESDISVQLSSSRKADILIKLTHKVMVFMNNPYKVDVLELKFMANMKTSV